MDGRAVPISISANRPLPGGARAGSILGPAILIPLLVQFDSCALRKEWLKFNAFAFGLMILGLLNIVAIRAYPKETARGLRGAQLLIFAFCALAVIALFGSLLPMANLDEGGKYIFFPTADAVLFVLAVGASVMCRQERPWRLAMCASMGAIVGSIMWDSLYPATFSELTTRAAGFGVNPNTGGAIVATLLIGLLTWDRPGFHPLAVLSILISGAGVFLTLSRSSLLCWGLIVAAYVVTSMIRKGASAWLSICVVGMPLMLFAASAGERVRQAIPMLNSSHQRIEAFFGDGQMDHADDSRVHIAEHFLELALERPWLGWGTGLNTTFEEGAHNIFLAKWVENGVPALATVLLLIFATYRLGRLTNSMEAQVLAGFVLVQGFFSHNMFEDKTVLIMWGVIAGRAVHRFSANSGRAQTSSKPSFSPRASHRVRPQPRVSADAA